MDARNYLKAFLSKIAPDEYNRFDSLSLIKANYLAETSKSDCQITLFDFFEDFITGGDKSIALRKRHAEEIVRLILNPEKDFSAMTPAEIKEEACKTLDEWISNLISIKRSVADYKEEKEDARVSTDDNFKNEMKDAILSEIDPMTIAPAVADVQFNRRNKLMSLWNRCENELEKLYNDRTLLARYNFMKYIAIDGTHIEYGSDMQTVSYKDTTDVEQTELHAQKLKCLIGSQNSCGPAQIQISNEPYMKLFKSHCRDSTRRDKTLLIFADNEYNAGHNADLGNDSAIVPLYYTSTIHAALNRSLFLYPMGHTVNILIPCVLVFLDSENEYKKIDHPYIGSVLLYAPNFKSSSESLDVKFRKQIYNALCIAANLKYEYIIINDGSAQDNQLNACDTVRIIKEVAQQFTHRFHSITKAA